MEFHELDELKEKEILELYNGIVESGEESMYISASCSATSHCTNGRSASHSWNPSSCRNATGAEATSYCQYWCSSQFSSTCAFTTGWSCSGC